MKSSLHKRFLFIFNVFFMVMAVGQTKDPLKYVNEDGTTEKDTSVKVEEKHITYFKEGLKLIDSADYKAAISQFKKSYKNKRDYYEAYLKSAYCKIKLEDYSGAEKDLDLASQYGPNDFQTYKLKGINYFLMGSFPDSKTCLDSALALLEEEKIDDAEFFYYRGKLMFAGKSNKKALEAAVVALEMDPKYYDAMKLKCEIRFAAKEYPYALLELNETIKALPETKKDYKLYKMRAKTKFELKDYKGAASDWDVYIEAIPDEEEALIERAMALINSNSFTKAIIDLDNAIKLNPKNPVSYCYRGVAKGSNKQIVEGIKDLDYAIKLKFDYSTAYVNRAALKMAAKDKRGACDDLQKADSLGNDMAPGLFERYCKN